MPGLINLAALAASVGPAATETVTVHLGKHKVRILPQMDWPYEAVEAIQRGDFRAWAADATVNDLKITPAKVVGEKVTPEKVTGSNDAEAFAGKFTVRELIEFMSEYESVAGISLGK